MKNISKVFWTGVRILFALFIVYAGVQHFVKPDFFVPFVPSFSPFAKTIIYVSGLLEVLFGLILFIPKYIKMGAFGIMLLMILFLPIHIWDFFSDMPAIGSHKAALIRLPFQFLFIVIAWKIKSQ